MAFEQQGYPSHRRCHRIAVRHYDPTRILPVPSLVGRLGPQAHSGLSELDAIIEVLKETVTRLQAKQKASAEDGEKKQLTVKIAEMSRQNLLIWNKRKKIINVSSLGPVIFQLCQMKAQAERANEALEELADLLDQAAIIGNILAQVVILVVPG
ncbi:MAG: hypothetical protein GJ677_10240 [Rhodobacteraceae bacterium]|nr:hypothetical protein [Paracoccaceae bacterium]